MFLYWSSLATVQLLTCSLKYCSGWLLRGSVAFGATCSMAHRSSYSGLCGTMYRTSVACSYMLGFMYIVAASLAVAPSICEPFLRLLQLGRVHVIVMLLSIYVLLFHNSVVRGGG
jgi:hypothetical protein